MSALAKTNDYFFEADESTYLNPPTFKAVRTPTFTGPSTLINPIGINYTTPKTPPKSFKVTQPYYSPQSPATHARSFQLLQQWEGKVESVGTDTFMAILSDKNNKDNADEEVEIYFSEIAPDDLPFVRPGSLFYWSVGYEDGLGIPRQRVSRIRFRRLPGLTARDIQRAKNNSKKLANLFA